LSPDGEYLSQVITESVNVLLSYGLGERNGQTNQKGGQKQMFLNPLDCQ